MQHGMESIKLAAGETLNRRAGFSRKLTQAAAFTCKAFTPSDPSKQNTWRDFQFNVDGDNLVCDVYWAQILQMTRP